VRGRGRDEQLMHELPITERILDIVLRHAQRNGVERILTIHLKVGELSDLEDEWIQHYFDYLSRGTPAENARLAIRRTPIVLQCDACDASFEVRKRDLGDARCPECDDSPCRLVSGREYVVENMEAV